MTKMTAKVTKMMEIMKMTNHNTLVVTTSVSSRSKVFVTKLSLAVAHVDRLDIRHDGDDHGDGHGDGDEVEVGGENGDGDEVEDGGGMVMAISPLHPPVSPSCNACLPGLIPRNSLEASPHCHWKLPLMMITRMIYLYTV